MTILTLDLGTNTGWALGDKSGVISSGTRSLVAKGSSRFEGGGMRFLQFRKWLQDLHAVGVGITAIYFEEVRNHKGIDAAHIYGGLLATLTSWAESENIPYLGIPVGTIKKHATGSGNANKEAMIAAAIKRGHKPIDDNEADALAIFYYAHEVEHAAA